MNMFRIDCAASSFGIIAPSPRFVVRQPQMAVGEGLLGQVPDGVALAGHAPAVERSIVSKWRRPAQDAQAAVFLQHAPIVRDEIHKFPGGVEDQLCRHGIAAKCEGHAGMGIVHLRPGKPGIDQT